MATGNARSTQETGLRSGNRNRRRAGHRQQHFDADGKSAAGDRDFRSHHSGDAGNPERSAGQRDCDQLGRSPRSPSRRRKTRRRLQLRRPSLPPRRSRRLHKARRPAPRRPPSSPPRRLRRPRLMRGQHSGRRRSRTRRQRHATRFRPPTRRRDSRHRQRRIHGQRATRLQP